MSKVWTKEEIKAQLQQDDRWVNRALVALYNKQTEHEQHSLQTVELNGVGFSGFDAEFLSSLAERVRGGQLLTPKQLEVARKRVLKYAGQLAKIANGEL